MMKGYITSLKPYVIAVSFLFITMFIVGYFFGEEFSFLWEHLKKYFESFPTQSNFQMMLTIFWNNLKITLLVVLSGVIFGIVPILIISFNGFVIGLAFYHTIKLKGAEFFLMGTIPHGVVEYPVILLSSAIGIKWGYETYKKIRSEGSILKELKKGLMIYIVIILPLLFLAAFIEAYITSSII